MTDMPDVGISDMELFIPQAYVEMSEFEDRRKIPKGLVTEGLGIKQMAVMPPYHDPASMAATAAYRLLQRTGTDPEAITRIDVGTESSLDGSKPLGTNVIGMLEKVYGEGAFEPVMTCDRVFACVGAVIGMRDAFASVRAGEDEAALVIATDNALYDIGSVGEKTQGAGAVAMLIEKNPKIARITPKVQGTATQNRGDFLKPDGRKTPIVQSMHSVQCYLETMRNTASRYWKKGVEIGVIDKGTLLSDYFDTINFHIPYPSMTKKAAAAWKRHELKLQGRWDDVKNEIKESTGLEEPREKFSEEDLKYLSQVAKTKVFKPFFQRKVHPSLSISSRVGNIYTGSAFQGVISTLLLSRENGVQLAEKRGGLMGYGSGCAAVGRGLEFVPGWENVVGAWATKQMLDGRTKIGMDIYEQIRGTPRHDLKIPQVPDPSGEFILREVTGDGWRKYKWVD